MSDGEGQVSSNEGDYYRKWYEDNKEEISKKRRAKYRDDEEYRQRVLERNREYRKTLSKGKESGGGEGGKARAPANRKARKSREPVLIKIPLHGAMVERRLVHIGDFAKAINRSIQCIYQWERRGVFPRTPFVMKGVRKEERLYLPEMADVVVDVLNQRGHQISLSDPTFGSDVAQGWRAIGVEVND